MCMLHAVTVAATPVAARTVAHVSKWLTPHLFVFRISEISY